MLRYRLHTTPSRVMPLNVRSAGHYQLAPHGAENRGPGDFLQVFWSVAGSGTFTLDDVSHTIRPGTLFYYVAGEPHQLLAGPEGWDYRWLTFDGERHRTIPNTYGLSRVQAAGPCPSDLFEQLDACLQDPTANGELRASVLGYEIILLASSPHTDGPSTHRGRRHPLRPAGSGIFFKTHRPPHGLQPPQLSPAPHPRHVRNIEHFKCFIAAERRIRFEDRGHRFL